MSASPVWVRPLEVVNATRPGLPDYFHQIDLYWETEVNVARYVHIANAKWRVPPEKIGLEDILLLQQVKTKIGAHKAVMITTVGSQARVVEALQVGAKGYIRKPFTPEQVREKINEPMAHGTRRP